jgi:hypothetical protein
MTQNLKVAFYTSVYPRIYKLLWVAFLLRLVFVQKPLPTDGFCVLFLFSAFPLFFYLFARSLLLAQPNAIVGDELGTKRLNQYVKRIGLISVFLLVLSIIGGALFAFIPYFRVQR